MITRAQGNQKIVVNQVKSTTVTEVNNAKTMAQKLLINTEQKVAVMGINAQTDKVEADSRYSALKQECKAEESNLDAINAERQHQYEMRKAEAYNALGMGKHTKIVMSGSSGENLINKIFDLN
jgi:hypothetical protein